MFYISGLFFLWAVRISSMVMQTDNQCSESVLRTQFLIFFREDEADIHLTSTFFDEFRAILGQNLDNTAVCDNLWLVVLLAF